MQSLTLLHNHLATPNYSLFIILRLVILTKQVPSESHCGNLPSLCFPLPLYRPVCVCVCVRKHAGRK